MENYKKKKKKENDESQNFCSDLFSRMIIRVDPLMSK